MIPNGAAIILIIGCCLVLVWFGVRIHARLAVDGRPCPYAFAWIVDNPLRRMWVPLTLDRIGIQAGEHVLELGPGPGAFTVDATRRVGPDGKLIAVDIQSKMIEAVERKVTAAGLANVEMVVADAYSLPLDDASIDRAFLVTVLPEIPDKQRALAELRRVLKVGGILSITEQLPDPDYPLVRTTIRWAEEAGFSLVARYGNILTYTLNFRSPA
jgi:ubiquinone/menaquinone biosynthesis C-methylase UbiE